MIATSLTGNRRAGTSAHPLAMRGFTLLELIVVTAIIALALSVVAPRISHSLDASRFNAAVRDTLSGARRARAIARAEQRETTLIFDTAERRIRVDGNWSRTLNPDSLTVEVTAAESERLSRQEIAVRFFADGSATGGRVRFAHGKRSQIIDIDWLTGRAAIVQ